MDAKKYHQAVMLSTQVALRSGTVSLPEIIGILEMVKINAERQAYEQMKHATAVNPPKGTILRVHQPLPPGLDGQAPNAS